MKRKIFRLLALLSALILLLSACGSTQTTEETTAPHDSDTSYKAVIIQSGECTSNTEARQAFVSRMRILGYDEAKMKFDVKSAEGDSQKLSEIVSSLANSDYDLIISVGAEAAAAVTEAQLTVPSVFISVADPVGAGLMSSLDTPDKGITGSVSDTDAEELVTLIKILTPNVGTVAIMYTPNSSETEISEAEQRLADRDFATERVLIENTDDIETDAADVLTRADAIFIPSDEALENSVSALVSLASQSGKYVFASDPGSVKDGALACVSTDPEALAKSSAEIADKLLRGEDVSTVPADCSAEPEIYISKSTCTLLNVEIPDLENSHIV